MRALNRVVIVEGPDGAGKTTLCRELKERYREWGASVAPIMEHEGVPAAGVDPFTSYTEKLLRYLTARVPRVLDRFHLGETVYGPICRGESKLGAYGVRLLDRLCAAYGVAIIVALPARATCVANWRLKDDYVKTEATFSAVYDAYVSLKFRYLAYDYEREGSLTDLFEYLNKPRPTLPLGAAGSPAARVLLVGERPNGALDLPFHALTNSSRYLNDALERAGLPEYALALANARRWDNQPFDLHALAAQLPNLRLVVPLGNVAARAVHALAHNGVDVLPLPHPQHWKRFHAREAEAYVQMLKEVKRVAL